MSVDLLMTLGFSAVAGVVGLVGVWAVSRGLGVALHRQLPQENFFKEADPDVLGLLALLSLTLLAMMSHLLIDPWAAEQFEWWVSFDGGSG